ncbi:hypothetical protein O1R50_05860 [Glycomyces luteolus]|uniref:Uncharacterized protein n=1 Tax=Glycomyces luteolus TaxID=2670330 RepID=A0A9X3P6G3_9ACTN|nr:hypothetical protein [Glycomyces luteolus]MDA1359137.1 hypothetical protein [Glycomyces luteolus]
MVELVLAGAIIGAACVAAVVTSVLDRRRRRRRRGAGPGGATSGEPIPSGWTANDAERGTDGERADPAAGAAAVR